MRYVFAVALALPIWSASVHIEKNSVSGSDEKRISVQFGIEKAAAQVCLPPLCVPPPPPPPPGGGGSPASHHHASAGKVAGQIVVYGLAASSAALVVRGGYVSATENREMMYGEAYCTAETFSPLVFKPIRLLGDLFSGQFTPPQDIIFCPEGKLNKYSAKPQPKKHKKKRKKAVLPRPRP